MDVFRGARSPERAFTLVEILVVLSIISVLTGVLLPVLGSAREAARATACASTQRSLVMGVFNHMLANDYKIPGVNTTGRPYHGDINNGLLLNGDTSSETPTSTFDWISPSVGASMGFSPNRAERTREIFETLACPSAGEMNARLFGYAPDLDDFERIQARDGFRQISYLSPAAFHLTGHGWRYQDRWMRHVWTGPVVTPKRYFPRMAMVGEPASKIFLADGTRYLPVNGQLDFDVSLRPEYFGSFTSSGPIYIASTAYGDRPNSPQFSGESGGGRGSVSANNRELSYRHAGGMNVAWFDGHVSMMSEHESKSDATPWYPRGSVITDLGQRAAPEASHGHTVGEVLR